MRTATLVAACLASLSFGAGCGPENRNDGDGTDGDSDSDSNTDSDSDANTDSDDGFPDAADGCSDEAKLVYVVDANNTLYTFSPMTKQFTSLGMLDCNPGPDPNNPLGGEATPFSMAVDRDSNAYILFSNSKIFKVDTHNNPLTCQNLNYVPQMGLELFGMGFSTDSVGGTTDKLFITGGPADTIDPEANSKLAVLDVDTMQVSAAGNVAGSPELTGNGNAELWGFFPGNNPRVGKLNKGTGALDMTYMPGGMLQGTPAAWAFAFWGGDYWVFLMKGNDTSTTVYQINGSTGAVDSYTAAAGKRIVGAGVSTCAPVVVGKQ